MARRTTVTINDVANEAGVALGTVSNAFNHPEKFAPRPQAHQRGLRETRLRPQPERAHACGWAKPVVWLVLPSLEHGISLQIANGANAEAQKHGYGLLIANADNDDILSARYLTYFMGTQMAGILVQPMSVYGWKLSLATPSVPTVYLDFHSSEPGYFVGADNRAQGRLVAQHAIDAGARRIAVFGKDEFEKIGMRIAGVRDIMHTAAGVAFEFIDEGAWNLARDGYSVGYRLAKRPASERPDFIIALSDVLATGAVAGIQAAGSAFPATLKSLAAMAIRLPGAATCPSPPSRLPATRSAARACNTSSRRSRKTAAPATPCPPKTTRHWSAPSCSPARARARAMPPNLPIRTWISAGTCKNERLNRKYSNRWAIEYAAHHVISTSCP